MGEQSLYATHCEKCVSKMAFYTKWRGCLNNFAFFPFWFWIVWSWHPVPNYSADWSRLKKGLHQKSTKPLESGQHQGVSQQRNYWRNCLSPLLILLLQSGDTLETQLLFFQILWDNYQFMPITVTRKVNLLHWICHALSISVHQMFQENNQSLFLCHMTVTFMHTASR